MDVPVQEEKENFPFLPAYSCQLSMDCMMPAHIDEGKSVLTLLIKTLFSSRNTFTDTPRNVLPVTWDLLAQWSWHIKLTTTWDDSHALTVTNFQSYTQSFTNCHSLLLPSQLTFQDVWLLTCTLCLIPLINSFSSFSL